MSDTSRLAPYDLEAAVEVFCQRVVHRFSKMKPEDQQWYRELWMSDAEAVVRAALSRTQHGENDA